MSKNRLPLALLVAALVACAENPLSPTVAQTADAAASGSSGTTSTSTSTARIRIFADLVAPSDAQFPNAKGKAKFDSRNNNTKREFEIEVEHLPAGTAVEFFLNGVKLGAGTTNGLGEAALEVSTELGQSVPMAAAGLVAEVRSPAGAVIVTGSFPGA